MLSKLAELYLSMSSASVPVEAMFSGTGDKLHRILFMTIMHTYLILNRQKTMNMNDFYFSDTFIAFINVDLIA